MNYELSTMNYELTVGKIFDVTAQDKRKYSKSKSFNFIELKPISHGRKR
jgi:hypothetical protein